MSIVAWFWMFILIVGGLSFAAGFAWELTSNQPRESVCVDQQSFNAISRRLRDVEQQLENALVIEPAKLGPPERGD